MIRVSRWTALALTAASLLLALLMAGMRVAKADQDGDKKTSVKATNFPKEESKPAHPLRASFEKGGNLSAFRYLETEMVRKELQLTEVQKDKIAPLLTELHAWYAPTTFNSPEDERQGN